MRPADGVGRRRRVPLNADVTAARFQRLNTVKVRFLSLVVSSYTRSRDLALLSYGVPGRLRPRMVFSTNSLGSVLALPMLAETVASLAFIKRR